jgi:NAD(P)-dependent dehydrogenase (short-subunit alcohol dehydrogenase family)
MLITGAAGGIGRAVVQIFHEHGWRVVGVDRAEFGPGFLEDGLFIRADILIRRISSRSTSARLSSAPCWTQW